MGLVLKPEDSDKINILKVGFGYIAIMVLASYINLYLTDRVTDHTQEPTYVSDDELIRQYINSLPGNYAFPTLCDINASCTAEK